MHRRYNVAAQEGMSAMSYRDKKSKYALSMLSVATLFGIANALNLSRTVCFDCFLFYGVPFAFYQDGGFGGGARILWRGVAADALVLLVCGIAVAEVWERISQHRSQNATNER